MTECSELPLDGDTSNPLFNDAGEPAKTKHPSQGPVVTTPVTEIANCLITGFQAAHPMGKLHEAWGDSHLDASAVKAGD